MRFQDLKNGRFYWEDCFDVMKEIPDGVVDMVLCDLPYGTTQCKWDTIISFDKLWAEYWRILKSNGVIVLTAAQPFTANLIMSQINCFKYEWIWKKNTGGNFSAAKYQPIRYHESILIFSKGKTIYNPQPTERTEGSKIRTKYKVQGNANSEHTGKMQGVDPTQYDSDNKNPESVLFINTEPNSLGKLHPTQKPVALFEYLIKTYTNENDLVLDNCAGSGTTAIAAINTNRRWICIEKEEKYANKAIERIRNHEMPLNVNQWSEINAT